MVLLPEEEASRVVKEVVVERMLLEPLAYIRKFVPWISPILTVELPLAGNAPVASNFTAGEVSSPEPATPTTSNFFPLISTFKF